MKELRALRIANESPPPKGSRYAVCVADPKTPQAVVIASDEPLEGFVLDDPDLYEWPEGEAHPDAVVIGELDGERVVVFLELTQSVKVRVKAKRGAAAGETEEVDPITRKTRQIDGGAAHFHPSHRTGGSKTHGDEHHDRWAAGADLPDLAPDRHHRVGGLVIGFHQSARAPVGPTLVGGVRVPRAVWSPVPSSRGHAEITFRDVARQLGW